MGELKKRAKKEIGQSDGETGHGRNKQGRINRPESNGDQPTLIVPQGLVPWLKTP
jgi:hypothetical protein